MRKSPPQKLRRIERPVLDAATRTTILTSASGPADGYHWALSISWPRFLVLLAGAFLLVNVLFGALYDAVPGTIAGTRADSLIDHIFFSVQTLATIGYGAMYPRTTYGHILVTVEAMIGMLGVGLVAALAFARLSLPRARIRFSQVAVVTEFDGVPTLMLRAANERTNALLSARVQVSLLRPETSREGHRMRRFYDLALARSESPIFALSWTVMHPITASSPLHGLGAADYASGDFAIIVTITGLDETVAQTVHARQSYLSSAVRFGHRFVDMIEDAGPGQRLVNLTRIDDTEPATPG